MKTLFIFFFLLSLGFSSSAQEIVKLKTGEVFEGQIDMLNSNKLKMTTKYGKIYIYRDKVHSIYFTKDKGTPKVYRDLSSGTANNDNATEEKTLQKTEGESILRSDDGTCWKVFIGDDGNVVKTKVPCP